ncbi:MAG: hypothetical protein LBN26_04120 [Christensenellaceae bacterium]|jgi:hypothetical protein|nr:hypothetical protein [Christensenellaceae bacterium]
MTPKTAALLALALCCLLLAGCVNTSAPLLPERTLPPIVTPSPSPPPEDTPPLPIETPARTPVPGVDTRYDALGEYVSDSAHFQRYLTFENIQVYEQSDDTFMDAVLINAYPQELVCALNIAFYDEDGQTIASGRVQTRDGQYVLRLPPGETVLFSQIDTDMSLTALKFSFLYDETLGVLPG